MPKEIRRRLGLSAGDRVDFTVENGRVILRPASGLEKYRDVHGAVPEGKNEIKVWMRILRDD